jgi:conjugal transfer mating pair stabilization protein TraN
MNAIVNRWTVTAFASVFASACGVALAQTPSSVFNDAKAFGNAAANTAKGQITTTTGGQTVPNYATSSSEGAFFLGGRGSLTGPTVNKLTNCQGRLPTDAYTDQECNAINYLRGLPNGWSISGQGSDTNAVVGASQDVLRNPGSYNGTSTGTYCKQVTRWTPEKYVDETCNKAIKTEYPKCTKRLIVEIDWDMSCPSGTIKGPTPIPSNPVFPPKYQCEVKTTTYTPTCPPPLIGPPFPLVAGLFFCKDATGAAVPAVMVGTDEVKTVTLDATPIVRERWSPECDALEARANDAITNPVTCELQTKVCTQGPETRVIDTVPVTRDCWAYQEEFACIGKDATEECESISGKSCVKGGTSCLQYTNNSKLCAIETTTYRCLSAPAVQHTATVCDTATFCDGTVGGACFDTANPADQDFARAAGAMEAQREAGVYAKDLQLFRGTAGTCKVKVLGGSTIKSCCKGQPGGGAFKNSAILNAGMSAGMTIVGEAGKEALRAGSTYVFDALYTSVDGTFLEKGIGAARDWASGIGDGVFNPSFSFYGFTFTFDFTNGFQFTGFDPVSFAIAVGIQLIQQWLECDNNDQMTMVKKGANLCTQADQWCSKRLPIIRTCIEKTESYCCFNSTLAKIINRQGYRQLGWDQRQCGGFDEAAFNRLDFSRMDFSEFLAEVSNPPDGRNVMNARTGMNVGRLVNNYYTYGTQRP